MHIMPSRYCIVLHYYCSYAHLDKKSFDRLKKKKLLQQHCFSLLSSSFVLHWSSWHNDLMILEPLILCPLFCCLGGFYCDDVGYVGTTGKKCPNGSFVAYDKAPGTQVQDCKTCPLGK